MKTYFPNYFKKIAIIIFVVSIVFSFLSSLHSFVEGFEEGYNSASSEEEQISIKADPFTEQTRSIFKWTGLTLSFCGLIMYMFSSEKVEDEFFQHLRYKALVKSLILIWIIYGLVYIFKEGISPQRINLQWNTDGLSVLQAQLIFYVIIYKRLKNREQ